MKITEGNEDNEDCVQADTCAHPVSGLKVCEGGSRKNSVSHERTTKFFVIFVCLVYKVRPIVLCAEAQLANHFRLGLARGVAL